MSGIVYCKADKARNHIEGDITVEIEWPSTAAGSRRIIRCPYTYDHPSYAYRDCRLLLTDQQPTWSDANATMCPYPPFSQGVKSLANFMVGSLLCPSFCLFTLATRVIAIVTCLSVRPSVGPSVMRRYCVKTKKARVMIFFNTW